MALRQAIDFIDSHLSEALSVASIAEQANYSAFHFHRLFSHHFGETVSEYITRRRLEITASQLMRNHEISITELSIKNGFNSNSSLTRAFKKKYGVSPTEFRSLSPSRYSKISEANSKHGQGIAPFEPDLRSINQQLDWIHMHTTIEIKDRPATQLAYIPQVGPQGLGEAFGRLMKWARPLGLLSHDFLMLTVYHDSFKITPAHQVRMSAGLVLDRDVAYSGEVKSLILPAGKHIVAKAELSTQDFPQAWSSLFVWMNEQGYAKGEADPFEIYYNDFNTHPEKKCIVDLCIPIK